MTRKKSGTMNFKVFISFVHSFGIVVKEKRSPFNQGIIHQPIMSINKVITPMTELSDPPSYTAIGYAHVLFLLNDILLIIYYILVEYLPHPKLLRAKQINDRN